ncbi:hypothetical protein A5819_003738 [Enterococcus sp. 7E2_DIV0204]|nr:hypothetical protein A5819_003738 [Enterococcus sp. 7E2_DIV0204]OTP47129.1 hypothetical protein A5884_003666 [Enterococcus sp. 7D2_DIV0200]
MRKILARILENKGMKKEYQIKKQDKQRKEELFVRDSHNEDSSKQIALQQSFGRATKTEQYKNYIKIGGTQTFQEFYFSSYGDYYSCRKNNSYHIKKEKCLD